MLFELIKDHLFLSIYILINLIVFFLYGIDKWKAIHHKWRIPEAHLILAGVFGIFGAVLGMLLFRHKIRKPKFYIGLPAIFILELMCVIFYPIKVILMMHQRSVHLRSAVTEHTPFSTHLCDRIQIKFMDKHRFCLTVCLLHDRSGLICDKGRTVKCH